MTYTNPCAIMRHHPPKVRHHGVKSLKSLCAIIVRHHCAIMRHHGVKSLKSLCAIMRHHSAGEVVYIFYLIKKYIYIHTLPSCRLRPLAQNVLNLDNQQNKSVKLLMDNLKKLPPIAGLTDPATLDLAIRRFERLAASLPQGVCHGFWLGAASESARQPKTPPPFATRELPRVT